MLVLGIDPGSVNTGFAWIRGTDHHVQFGGHKSYMSTWWKNIDRVPYRWCRMRDRLEGHLKQLPEPPGMVAIEEPARERCTKPDDRRSLSTFFGAYAIVVAEVSRMYRGTVMVPVRYLTWNGGLSKPDILERLKKRYFPRVPWKCEDESDALGLADFAWGIMTTNRKKVLCSNMNSLRSSEPPSEKKTLGDGIVSGS